jgi:hypothetical protein
MNILTATTTKQKKQYFYNDRLPLAIYREIAAHLESVNKVKTGTIIQDSPQFDYAQSQLKGIWLEIEGELDHEDQAQIKEILAYYGLS